MSRFFLCFHRYLFSGLWILFAISFVQPAQAQRLKVKLGDLSLKRYPIAVPDFKGDGRVAQKTVAILRKSLDLCGAFRVLSPASYLERAPRDGFDPNSFDFEPWKSVGAEGILKGNVMAIGSSYRLQFRFYEVGTQKLALQQDYIASNDSQVRWYTHLFADHLYKFMTGEPGIFASKVSFIRNNRGKQEVWLMDVDGQAMQRLTNNGSINALPAWSPNGRYIAYTSWKERNPDIFVHDINTGKAQKISSFQGLNTGATWSPDSQRIAFSASRGTDNMNIYIVNADGSGLQQLTQAKWGERNLSPSWSADGKQITFVSTRFASPQIFVMNVDGSGARRVSMQGNYNQAPKWSPRGDWILFTGRDERNVFDLFLVSPTDGQVKRLTQNQGSNIEATWSPNGRNIIFVSTRNGVAKLFIMTHEGKHQRQITFQPGQYLTPSWSPRLSKD